MTNITVKDGLGANQVVFQNDEITDRIGDLTDSKQIDPDAASATLLALVRGLMQLVEDGVVTQGTASAPSAEYLSTHARLTEQVHVFRSSPTVSTSAYAAGDVVGGEIEITNAARISGDGGFLATLSIMCEDDLAAGDLDVFIFKSNPASTYTDNSALPTSADADAFELITAVNLGEKIDLGDGALLQARNIMVPYQCDATSLFAVPVCRNAFTLTATTAIHFAAHLARD